MLYYQQTKDVLRQNEKRREGIAFTLNKYNRPVLNIRLNLPGPLKRTLPSDFFLTRFIEEFLDILAAKQIQVLDLTNYIQHGFWEYRLCLELPSLKQAQIFKQMLIQIEEGKARALSYEPDIYRLLDLDLYLPSSYRKAPSKQKLHLEESFTSYTRQDLLEDFPDLDIKKRQCFICSKPAIVCASRRLHTLEDLKATIDSWLIEAVKKYFKKKICLLAEKALLFEIMVSPKPGLVDRFNQGSHQDMDTFTFIESTLAIRNALENYVDTGFDLGLNGEAKSNNQDFLKNFYQELKELGLRGEKQMYQSTQGVNTHKGLVFAFALILGSYAYELGCQLKLALEIETAFLQAKHSHHGNYPQELYPDADKVFLLVGNLGKFILEENQQALAKKTNLSNGEKLFLTKGITGARGMASQAYHPARKAKDIIQKHVLQGQTYNTACLFAWTYLAGRTQDTCYLSRLHKQNKLHVKKQVEVLLKKAEDAVTEEDLIALLTDLDKVCIDNDLSFGGVADLLCLAIFLDKLDNFHLEEV